MSKKLIFISVLVFLLAGLIFLVGSALASTIPTDNLCGNVYEPAVSTDGNFRVKKEVTCSMERSWTWDIEKTADQSELLLAIGQVFQSVKYTVTAKATAADTNFAVSGKIIITAVNDVYISDVSDSLGEVDCGGDFSLPGLLPAGWTKECTYSGNPETAASENTATVTADTGETATITVPIDWSKASTSETDECADISDTYAGFLGKVCAGEQTKFTFNYYRDIGPYDVCGTYTVKNTASFVTNDTGATGSDDWTIAVEVPCAGGCTLTPGYWKTHSSYGPAPYDNTWALLGENTPFYLSGKTYYQVLWTQPKGNAYYILAHAYIAAKLNVLNGAATTSTVDGALSWADTFFSIFAPGDTLSKDMRAAVIMYAGILDNYNNGLIGPGHCSE